MFNKHTYTLEQCLIKFSGTLKFHYSNVVVRDDENEVTLVNVLTFDISFVICLKDEAQCNMGEHIILHQKYLIRMKFISTSYILITESVL